MPDLPATWASIQPQCGPGPSPNLLRLRLYEDLSAVLYVDV